MTVTIKVAYPAMSAHFGNCKDADKTYRKGWANRQEAETYKGETLVDAIVAADEDMAAAFCEDVYQEDSTAWVIATCEWAPCLKDAIAREGIKFDERGRPSKTAR